MNAGGDPENNARAFAESEHASTMIRILFTIPNFITAGSQLELVRLIRRLDRSRFEPAVLISRAGGWERELLDPIGVPVHVAPYWADRGARLKRIWQSAVHGLGMRGIRGTLWHSYHYLDDYTEALAARVAGAKWWVYTKKNMSWGSRGWKWRSRLASHIIARNRRMMEEFFAEEKFQRKTTLIHAGVDTEEFRPAGMRLNCLRRRLGIPDEAVAFACVAQLVPVKGHRVLLEAFRRVANAHLLLAGDTTDAQYREELLMLSQTEGLKGRVHFLGSVRDVRQVLHESDAFVLPTLNTGRGEAFGVALIEAMSCGLACIASDTDGPREIIEPERSGFIVPAGDVAALAGAVQAICSSPELRQRLGLEARARVIRDFSLEEEVRKTQEVYERLIAQSDWRLA